MRINRSHTQNRYSKQIISSIVVLVLLVIFMLTVGIDLLVQTTHFIASVSEKKNTGIFDPNKNGVILAPELINVPNATNSAVLSIVGHGQADSKISIFVNDDPQKEIELDDKTEDFEAMINLDEGVNTVHLVLEDVKTKRQAKSKNYTVFYSEAKPKLEVYTPTPNQRVYNEALTISGSTDPGISVVINGRPVVVDSQGNFLLSINLSQGENKLSITATNDGGSVETKEVTVTYEKD